MIKKSKKKQPEDCSHKIRIFYSYSLFVSPNPLNKYTPSTALNPTAANVLNLSKIPKYCGGNATIPIGPINIMPRAIAAQIPTPLTSLSLHPEIISIVREIMDSMTTPAVTAICITSWEPLKTT